MGLTLLYTGKQQAFVFPDYELGDDREKMLDYMKEHIKEARKKGCSDTDRWRRYFKIFQGISRN